jgi:hypothetical protein
MRPLASKPSDGNQGEPRCGAPLSEATARGAAFGERAPDPPRPPVRSAH